MSVTHKVLLLMFRFRVTFSISEQLLALSQGLFMTLSLWILISCMPKAFWETSLWCVLGKALCFFVVLFLNQLTLILHQLLKLFPPLPLYFCPVKEILGHTEDKERLIFTILTCDLIQALILQFFGQPSSRSMTTFLK